MAVTTTLQQVSVTTTLSEGDTVATSLENATVTVNQAGGDVVITTMQGPPGPAAAWGTVTGTLSAQTDLASALALKSNIASPTFTGKVTTAASATGTAGLNLPHGAAPTSPANGDLWTTSAGGLFVRINGATVGPLGTGGGGGGTTTNALTLSNAGSGAASGSTFDGSVARTISYDSIGAAPTASPTFTGTVLAPIINAVSGVSLQFNASTKLVTVTGGVNVTGALAATGAVTGSNLSGTNTGDQTTITGNAGSATVLQTTRAIGITGGGITATGVNFNGSAAINLSASVDTGHITLARMADVATGSVFYRKTAATGAPEVQTLATLKTDLGLTGTNSGDQASIVGITGTVAQFNTAITDGDLATGGGTATGTNTGDQTITLTGNVTGSGTGSFATTIAAGVVTLANMANMATASLIYRKTAGSGAPEVNTLATLKTDLGLTGTNSGDQTITLTGDATGTGTGSFATVVGKINGVALSGLATGILKNTTTTGVPSIAVAADFPTLNQSTTGSAATLTTSRNFSISGGGITAATQGFNGSAAVVLSASVDNSHITLARMADVATSTVFYRKTAATGAPEVQTLATLKTDLGLTGTNSGDQTSIVGITGTIAQFNTAITDGDLATGGGTATGTNTGDQTITLTGNVTGSGTGSFATTIASNVVSNAMLSTVATATFKGRTTASTGNVEDLTATQATALLNAVVGDAGSGGTKGLVPAPASGDAAAAKFLKADGTWATPAGGGAGTTTNALTFNNAGTGDASGSTFNGSAAKTLSYNSIGAAPTASPTFTTGITIGGTDTPIISLNSNTTGNAACGIIESRTSAAALLWSLGETSTSNNNVALTATATLTLDGSTTSLAHAGAVKLATASGGISVTGTLGATGAVTGSNLSGTNTGDQTTVTGNAGTATTLQTSRNFSITGGGITASAQAFNGSAAVVLSASVDNSHITLARMADVATATVFYRKTAATGAPEVQTLATLKTDLGLTGTNSGDQTITLTGDVTGSGTGSFAATLATNQKVRTITYVVDGGGATITTGLKGFLEIPFACTINQYTVLCDQSGSIVFDIWKDTYANYPPTIADTITASAKPTVSAATKAQSSTLTGWTTTVNAGDILGFNVDSITTCQRVTLSLKVTMT